MPALIDRTVRQLRSKGHKNDAAYAMAISVHKKAGNIDASGKLTAKGKQRTKMGASGRAKDRASTYSGKKHSSKEYKYDPKTNRAKLKKKGKK